METQKNHGYSDSELDRLRHFADTSQGLWCLDQDPKEKSLEWIREHAFQLDTPKPVDSPVVINLKSLVQGLHIHVHDAEDAKLIGDAILEQLNRVNKVAASLSFVAPEPFAPEQEESIREIVKDQLVDILMSQREVRLSKSDELPA